MSEEMIPVAWVTHDEGIQVHDITNGKGLSEFVEMVAFVVGLDDATKEELYEVVQFDVMTRSEYWKVAFDREQKAGFVNE